MQAREDGSADTGKEGLDVISAGPCLSDALARVFDYLPEAAMVVDCQGVIQGWNRAMESLTGVKAADMLGKGNYEYSLPFYGSRRPILLDQLLSYQPAESRYQLVRHDNGTVSSENLCPGVGENGAYLQFSASLILGDDGLVLGAIQSFRDITEKRRTEEELLRIKKAVESASSAIWITDSRGQKVIYHNQAFADLFKFSREELNALGGTRSLYVDLQTADLVYRTLKEGSTWSGEIALHTKDGKVLPISLTGDVVRDEYGQNTAFVGVATDITLHKKTAADLMESRQRLADIIDFLPDATMVVDREGVVIAWNHAMEEMTGVMAEEMLGKGDYEYSLPFYGSRRPILIDLVSRPQDEVETQYQFIQREKQTLIAETRTPCVKGREAVLWCKANILYGTDNQPVGAIEAIRDITARIRAEEGLKLSLDNLQETLEGTVNALAETVERRDPYTAGHQERVASLACAIGREMGVKGHRIETLRIAAKIHDIGKIHLPADILSKPGILNQLERAMINTHPRVGHEIVAMIPFSIPVAEIVLQHHERMDGSGYPQGLKGPEIMLESCIIAVADVVEAMSMHRPYRPALGIEEALKEIMENRGRLYHEDVVDACLAVFQKGFAL